MPGGSYSVPPSNPNTPHPPTSGGGSSGGGTPSGGSSGSSGSSGGGGSSSSGGGSGSGGDPGGYKHKAVKRYMEQVATIQQQVQAVQAALGGEFRRALNTRLRNTHRQLKQQDTLLLEGYSSRVDELEKSSKDNEAAAGASSAANVSNAARERANALSQLALQGAGETDSLQAQQMALRNWAQNQLDISTSARDTATSIGASMTDLREGTQAERANLFSSANADRESLWSDYHDQREGALTQLGNLYGQQAELLGYAQEQINSKKTRRKLKRKRGLMGDAYDDASVEAGEAWKNPGVPKRVKDWEGSDLAPAGGLPQGQLNSSQTADAPAVPTGAGLRAW